MSTQELNLFNNEQTQRIAEDYRAGLIKPADIRNYVTRTLLSAGYKKQTLLGSPSEGYYYPDAREVSDYNKKVIEYNFKIRKYRQDVINAIMEYGTAPTAPSSPQPPQYRQVEAAAFQRSNVDREYPTPTEKPKPTPGPGAGPAPGTIGEKISEKLTPMAQQALTALDAPFSMVTRPIRRVSEKLKEESVGLPAQGKSWEGFGKYAAGTALSVGAGVFDVASSAFRPKLWLETAQSIGEIAFNPEVRNKAIAEVLRDPFGAAAVAGGSLYFGPKVKEFVFNEAEIAAKVFKAQGADVSEGLYGTSVKPSSYREFFREYINTKTVSRRPAKGLEVADLKLREDMGVGEFPDEAVEVLTYDTFEKSWLETVKDGVEIDFPYYSRITVHGGNERSFLEFTEPEWSPNLVTSMKDTAIPYNIGDEGGFLRVSGSRGGMKAFKDAKPAPPPRSEKLVPSGGAAPDTSASVLIQRGSDVLKDIEFIEVPSYSAVVTPLSETMFKGLDSVRIKSLDSGFDILPISYDSDKYGFDIFSVNKPVTKTLEKTVEKPDTRRRDPFNINIPISGLDVRSTPIQLPDVKLDMGTMQLPDQERWILPLQLPDLDLDEPQLVLPVFKFKWDERRPGSKKIGVEPEKKKKKKKTRRGKRGVLELRVDKAFNVRIKDVKI